ncbi:MAG: nitroreductase family protein [Alphaproteobacteria bacterium]|nr:MAG: nitroreductase family protein [Alphaproteobacteria bacterium]
MTTSDLYEAMRTQRAVRRIRPDPVPDDVLQRIFEAATYAPTGGNQQAWRMIAVTDPALKEQLGALYAGQWQPFSDNYRKAAETMDADAAAAMDRTLAAGDHLAANLGRVPVVVIVCFKPSGLAVTDIDQERVPVVGGGSIYPAVQNLMLAARAEGVGCVLTTLLCMSEPAVKKMLNIPDDWATAAMVPLGYSVGVGYGPISRKPVDKLFCQDQWDQAWDAHP